MPFARANSSQLCSVFRRVRELLPPITAIASSRAAPVQCRSLITSSSPCAPLRSAPAVRSGAVVFSPIRRSGLGGGGIRYTRTGAIQDRRPAAAGLARGPWGMSADVTPGGLGETTHRRRTLYLL